MKRWLSTYITMILTMVLLKWKIKGNDTQKFSGLNAQYSYEKGNITFNSRISANEKIVEHKQ